MGSLKKWFAALYQLSRPDPVAAWVGGAFILGAASAWHNTGGDIFVTEGIIAFAGVVIALAFGAHGLNDAYDWITGTDKESIGKGTGGTRVIPQGKLSVVQAVIISVIALFITAIVGAYFYLKYGWPILVLTALAVGAPVAYSVPPFKLAYRPFPELIIVLPSLTGVTLGAELVLSGEVTTLALIAGFIQAMLNISWYMVSRVPDYKPDKDIGKTTTIVYLGRDKAPLIGTAYLSAAMAAVPVGVLMYSPAFIVTAVFGLWSLKGFFDLDPYDPEQASRIRIRQVRKAWLHAAALSLAIVAVGW